MARLHDEYPDVFDAYWWRVTSRAEEAAGPGGRGSFRSRREKTRAERIRGIGRR